MGDNALLSEPDTNAEPTLRRQSSLRDVNLNTPSRSGSGTKTGNSTPRLTARPVAKNDSRDEVIPDSEEERIRTCINTGDISSKQDEKEPEVIEISSDSEDEQPRRSQYRLFSRVTKARESFTAMSGAWPGGFPPQPRETQTSSTRISGHVAPPLQRNDLAHSSTTTHVSDSQQESILQLSTGEQDVIELTDSDSEPARLIPAPKARPKPRTGLKGNPAIKAVSAGPKAPASVMLPLYLDDDPWEVDEESILTFNEPKEAGTPLRKKASNPSIAAGPSISTTQALPRSASRARCTLDSDSEQEPTSTNVTQTPTRTPRTQKQPRMTKKALAAAQKAKLAAYAEELFADLNDSVFQGGLPIDTKLVWSARLLTTAGKARWHKSSDGTKSASIELAMKILDSEERIRNTLSHEMCHLACWIVDRDAAEGHGKVWKSWACKVMRQRPDIEISTKHNYEIAYKYEWRCEKCSKIYGRHSKSINPEECVCGACKEGTLVPLFTTRKRDLKTPKGNAASSMAAEKGRDSPCALIRDPEGFPSTPTRGSIDRGLFRIEIDTLDSDIEDITRAIESVRIHST